MGTDINSILFHRVCAELPVILMYVPIIRLSVCTSFFVCPNNNYHRHLYLMVTLTKHCLRKLLDSSF